MRLDTYVLQEPSIKAALTKAKYTCVISRTENQYTQAKIRFQSLSVKDVWRSPKVIEITLQSTYQSCGMLTSIGHEDGDYRLCCEEGSKIWPIVIKMLKQCSYGVVVANTTTSRTIVKWMNTLGFTKLHRYTNPNSDRINILWVYNISKPLPTKEPVVEV